jgi:hypothetical protein
VFDGSGGESGEKVAQLAARGVRDALLRAAAAGALAELGGPVAAAVMRAAFVETDAAVRRRPAPPPTHLLLVISRDTGAGSAAVALGGQVSEPCPDHGILRH